LDQVSTKEAERGFTVIEVLIAALIFTTSTFGVFSAMRQLIDNAAHAASNQQNSAMIEQLASALESDSSTALAVYNPADDSCSGSSAADLTLAYKDAGGAVQSIAYQYDGTSVVTRNAGGSATSYSGVSLSAYCVGATELVQKENLAPNLPDITVHDYPVNLGAAGQTGGNRVMIVRLASTQTSVARELHLFAGAVPTGFTLIGAQWHAIVYRQDHTRRFLFGLGQVSWLQIWVEIEASYDNWQTSVRWCNWQNGEVYGSSPKFNQDDIPVYAGAPDSDPMALVPYPFANGTRNWALTSDFYPETLLQYCRSSVNPYPPGSPWNSAPAPNNAPTPDDQTLTPPPWYDWQYQCDPNANTCAGDRVNGQPPQPYANCDPLTIGSCTVPSDPPPGWPPWCAIYSPPNWGAPYFGSPCPQATPPPPPPSAPPPPPPQGTNVAASVSTTDSYSGNIDPFNSFATWSASISASSGSVIASDGGTAGNGDAGFADPGDSSNGPGLGYVIIGQFTTNTGTVNAVVNSFTGSGNGDVSINIDIFPIDRPPGNQAGMCGGPCSLNGTIALGSPGTYYVAAIADLYSIAGFSGCQQCAGGGNSTFNVSLTFTDQ